MSDLSEVYSDGYTEGVKDTAKKLGWKDLTEDAISELSDETAVILKSSSGTLTLVPAWKIKTDSESFINFKYLLDPDLIKL